MEDRACTFRLLGEDGEVSEYELLFTFDCEETGRRYIAYTDNSVDEDGCTRVFASVCAADGDNLRLLAIETEREWELLDTVLQQVHEEALAEDDCDGDP